MAIPRNKRKANKGVADLSSPQATPSQPQKSTGWEIPPPPLPLPAAQLPLATPPPTPFKGTQAEHVTPPGKKRKKTLAELMKVREESDGDEYVTGSEDVEGIEWYSTDHPGETIVDQPYRQNAELKKEIEDRKLISQRTTASWFAAGEERDALQEELDTYKAGEEKRLEKLKEEAKVEAQAKYLEGYEKGMAGWHYLRVEAARWKEENMELREKKVCWRCLGDKTSAQSSTQTDHVQMEELGSKSTVASYKDKEAQTDGALNKHKSAQTASRAYADALAQTTRVEDNVGTTDKMDIDPPTPPPARKKIEAVPLTAKDNNGTSQPHGHLARGYVVHGVPTSGPMLPKIREVERAFWGKGGGVIGVIWLLSYERRKGKAASSMVVFLKNAVPTAKEMYVRMRGRKYTVVEYQWGRRATNLLANG